MPETLIHIKEGFDPVDSEKEITTEQLQARIRWVATLRAKTYKKYRAKLASASTKSRCCLGVACAPEVVGFPVIVENLDTCSTFDGYDTQLPPSVSRALGFTEQYPRVLLTGTKYANSGTASLADLNDGKKPDPCNRGYTGPAYDNWSHPQIADLIEATYITPWIYED